MSEVHDDGRRARAAAEQVRDEVKKLCGDHPQAPPHIVLDKEMPGDNVTKRGVPRGAKSFGEPPWAT